MIYNAWLNKTYSHKIYCYGLHTTIIIHITFYITPATTSRYIGMYWFILLWGHSKDNKNSMVSYSRLLLEMQKFILTTPGAMKSCHVFKIYICYPFVLTTEMIFIHSIEKNIFESYHHWIGSMKPNDFSWPIHNTIVHNVSFVICCSHHVIFSIIQPSMKSYWNIYCTPYHIYRYKYITKPCDVYDDEDLSW